MMPNVVYSKAGRELETFDCAPQVCPRCSEIEPCWELVLPLMLVNRSNYWIEARCQDAEYCGHAIAIRVRQQ